MAAPSKSPTVIERVREMTRHAREREAEKVLNLKAVKAAISDAAADGQNTVTITPPKPIDLSGTDTAAATIEALKNEGFTVEWDVRAKPDQPTTKSMVVMW